MQICHNFFNMEIKEARTQLTVGNVLLSLVNTNIFGSNLQSSS